MRLMLLLIPFCLMSQPQPFSLMCYVFEPGFDNEEITKIIPADSRPSIGWGVTKQYSKYLAEQKEKKPPMNVYIFEWKSMFFEL